MTESKTENATNYVIKNRVGKTPLIRAEKLERELGLSKVYLKLEGNNPSGHREDRLAHLIFKDAMDISKDTICLGTYDKLSKSIAFLAPYYGLDCIFVLPKKHRGLRNKLLKSPHVKTMEIDGGHNDSLRMSQELSEKNGWYDANPGLANNLLNMVALSHISYELNDQVDDDIDTVFSLMSYGFAASGLHLGFRQLWVQDTIAKLPMLYSCTTDAGNAIYESYKKGSQEILPLKKGKASKYNRHLINIESSIAKDALAAVYDTGGEIIGLSDEELIGYSSRFKALERISLHTSAGYAIAGFMKEAEAGNLLGGNHVVLLNDGRANLEVRRVHQEEGIISKGKIIDIVSEWLNEYADPNHHISEALDNAFEKGIVLFAYHNGYLAGIAIVVNMGFEDFATKYHLAYIATKRNIKGRGIATELLQKCVELSGGNISLHVDKDNRRALQLYKKMGFKNLLDRMIYQSHVEE